VVFLERKLRKVLWLRSTAIAKPLDALRFKKRRPRTSVRAAGPRLQVACKPNSVEDDHSSRRRITTPLKRPTRRFPAHPGEPRQEPGLARRASTHPRPGSGRRIPPLFGLAPCGVYPATAFTDGAVRSYRTFSPLPRAVKPPAVCSLWHWPSLSLDAQIPDVIRHTALRSSDFPPPKRVNASAATAQLTCTSMLDHLAGFCRGSQGCLCSLDDGFALRLKNSRLSVQKTRKDHHSSLSPHLIGSS
jgi:hypothetical protein